MTDETNFNENTITNSKLYSMSKEEIETIIYDEDLSLEQLLIIKKISKSLGLGNYEKEYINETINDFIDVMHSENEIKNALELFNKYELTNAKLRNKARSLNIELEYNEPTFDPQKLKNFDSNSIFGEIRAEYIDKYIKTFPNFEKNRK